MNGPQTQRDLQNSHLLVTSYNQSKHKIRNLSIYVQTAQRQAYPNHMTKITYTIKIRKLEYGFKH